MQREKINVLHIIKSLGRGGAEMLLPETLKLHDKNKFEFHYIYFLPWKNQMVESIKLNGGKVTCFPADNNVELILKINKVVKYIYENKIDIVHAHLPWAGILARAVGKLTKAPIIYTEHNKQERYHFATRWANLATMNQLIQVIAVSDDVAESLHKYKPRLKSAVTKIANGVNIQHFDRKIVNGATVRAKFNIPEDAPIIGTIAVFRFQKRLDVWMEVAEKILDQHKEVHFIIVGDGPLNNDLYKKRKELGLEGRIHMPGLETEVRPYLFTFDIYMMCSIFEGLPVALLEAMAMECPIITTDAGGIKEVIRHKIDGFLCSTDEPLKLVSEANVLLNDSSLRLSYGRKARERILQNFSMNKMVSELESLYGDIIKI